MSLETERQDTLAARPRARRSQRRWVVAITVVLFGLLSAVALWHVRTNGSPPATPEQAPVLATGLTAAGTTNCASRPGVCGYPDASTTGVRAGVVAPPAPCPRITSAGQVVEAVTLTNCSLSVEVPGVVIRDVRMTVTAPDSWAVIVRPGGSARIEHVEISGADSAERSVQYAVLSLSSLPVLVDHADLHGCQDCVQGDHVTVTNTYIHDLASPPGAHVDGVICTSGCGITVRHNTIVNDHTQTSAVALFDDFAPPVGSVIDDNLLIGGGYTIYGGGATARSNSFTNNRIARSLHAEGGQWGPVTAFEPSGNTWSGNVWDDTLQPVG